MKPTRQEFNWGRFGILSFSFMILFVILTIVGWSQNTQLQSQITEMKQNQTNICSQINSTYENLGWGCERCVHILNNSYSYCRISKDTRILCPLNQCEVLQK